MPKIYTAKEKGALIERSRTLEITLDGEPAVIGGRLLKFGFVGTLNGSKRFEWSWAAIERVLNSGGQFKS